MSTQQNYKIIISGPVGAGKTTAIGALSDIPPVCTDAQASDHVADMKECTTVAMDYGVIDMGGGAKVHLYGTPGQDRFDFMWNIMTEGALGLILLINNAQPDPLADLRRFLTAFSDFIATAPACVGVTHLDEKTAPDLDQYQHVLTEYAQGRVMPVFSVDARSKQDMNILLMAILGMLDPHIVADVLRDAS